MNTNNQAITSRQLAFFLAFFMPIGKLLELPCLLVDGAGGDLLIAAAVGLIAEFLAFAALFFFCKRTGESPFSFLEKKWGKKATSVIYALFAVFLLVQVTLPLFDLEKFSHAAFSDTSPTFFIFAPFFILSGFICTKGIKSYGRVFDLGPALVLIPLLGLILMSVGQSDFSRLLPVMEKPLTVSLKTAWKTSAYFSSGGLLVPMLSGYRYEKGDGKKLFPAFAAGAALTLLFLACFFALFGLLGSKEHYALMKIAQYFPALKSIGRIDLLLVYSIAIALFYYTALPLQQFTECFTQCFSIKSKTVTAAVLSIALYFAVLFCNKYTTAIQAFFMNRLAPVFVLFSLLLPVLFLLVSEKNNGSRYAMNKKQTAQSEEKNETE